MTNWMKLTKRKLNESKQWKVMMMMMKVYFKDILDIVVNIKFG